MLKMTDSSPKTRIHCLRGAPVLAALAGSLLASSALMAQNGDGVVRSEREVEADARVRNQEYQERMRRSRYQESKRNLENLAARDPATLTQAERNQMQNLQRVVLEFEQAGMGQAQGAGALQVRDGNALGFTIEDPDELINLDFTEPVTLRALVDFIARALQVNITIAAGVSDDPLTFNAPIQVPARDLPVLLSTLLADRQAALVRELGWYRIVTEDRVPVGVVAGDLSTTRIIATPMIRPSSLQTVLTETFPGGSFRTSPIDDLGVLVLTGGSAQLERAERFISRIVEERAQLRLHRLPIRNVSAEFARQRIIDLDGVVNQAAAAPRPGPQQQQAPAGSLTNLGSFLYVDAGNALLFRGSQRDFERVAELAGVVDIVSPLVAKRYVAGSLVSQIAKAGEQLGLGPISSAEEASAQFTPGAVNRASAGGQQTAPSQFGSSRFVVDPQSGSFVYHGTPEQQERVDELVQDFRDQAIDTGVEIRIYKLTFASAGGDASARETGGGRGAGGGGGAGGGSARLQLGSDNATQPTGPGVAELLEALINNEQTTTGRFLPGAGQASVVNTDVINEILSEPEPDLGRLDQALATGDAGGTRLSATSDNTRIVADQARNQLIIRAPIRVHEQLGRIIEQLDRPRRQVLVEVKIVSLTTSDIFEFAADVQINAGDFSFLSAFGVTTPAAGSIQTPVTVGPSTGLTSAIIRSDYVPIAINALQRTGDARIVSTPQILVNDNQEGNIKSVRQEPFETTNQSAGTPTITSQGGFVEAGTELVVRPQIAGDNSVSLNFAIEVSNFDNAARRGNLTPPKQTEAYNSVVSVPSNSTIIVGGFRFDQISESIEKIPLIGDIPLVGELFRSTTKRDESRVIYVFITPTVIPEQGSRMFELMFQGPQKEAELDDTEHQLKSAHIPLSGVRLGDVRPDLADTPPASARRRTGG